MWDRAEAALEKALVDKGLAFDLNEGDGAFYGPKIDLHMTDSIGRSWQLGTVQLDYYMPERFDLTYTGADNADHRPVMIHRALMGSFERFIGILIEHYAGEFPLWLAPVQALVLPIADRHAELRRAAWPVELRDAGLRVEVDDRERVGGRARSARARCARCPTCSWSATASPRPARCRCAATVRAIWAPCRSASSRGGPRSRWRNGRDESLSTHPCGAILATDEGHPDHAPPPLNALVPSPDSRLILCP